MLNTIQNEFITVSIASKGAELQSVKGKDGTEYIWQGDEKYWTSHAPNIFPYVARLTKGKYILHGKEYGFGNHGLVRYEDLRPAEISETAISYYLESNDDTKSKYPFDFVYCIRYEIDGNKLLIKIRVENKDDDRMFFAVGGHPGFNVPLEKGKAFSDHYLEFDEEAHPYRILLADSGAIKPGLELYEMEDNKKIRLEHSLFDHDAIVLHHAAKVVSIKTDGGKHSIRVSYPDFRYIGFWHIPKSDAPFVCIEPWTSLPSREGIIEKLNLQADLLFLDPGQSWSTTWWIEFE